MTFHHAPATLLSSTAHAFVASSVFVLNLYLLVPSDVRKLDRNATRHIQWRGLSTLITTLFCMGMYFVSFCDDTESSIEEDDLLCIWGWCKWSILPILHTSFLYLGNLVSSLIQLHMRASNAGANYFKALGTEIARLHYYPYFGTYERRWITMRNIILAPFTEEVVFRSLIITPYLYTPSYRGTNNHSPTVSIAMLCWSTPLFFGLAHLHHFLLKLREVPSDIMNNAKMKQRYLLRSIMSTAFQCLYTTVFGSYASYVFIRTSSIYSVISVHAYCNFMGLPDLSIFQMNKRDVGAYQGDRLRFYKCTVAACYLVGILGFCMMFESL